jgi:hypothetical protein
MLYRYCPTILVGGGSRVVSFDAYRYWSVSQFSNSILKGHDHKMSKKLSYTA